MSTTPEHEHATTPQPATPDAVIAHSDEDVTLLRGVRTHNLKNIDCTIPHGALTVITGVSGSGKSSLAFETLYAEGQRRYTESLSTYARQFLQQLERPPVDQIRNIQPAIALRQHNEVHNSRSTVGTITEIDDHLQLVFTHIGRTRCPHCDVEVRRDTVTSGVADVLAMPEGARLIVVAQVEADDEAHRPLILRQLVQEGFRRVYLNGEVVDIDGEDVASVLAQAKIPVLIDRLVVGPDQRSRIAEAIEGAFALGKGRALLYTHKSDAPPLVLDRAFRCNSCGRDFMEPQPALFSFNSSLGACPTCTGFGKTIGLDFRKVVPNDNLTLERGAIVIFESDRYSSYKASMIRACMAQGVPIDLRWRVMSEAHRRFVRYGGAGWIGVQGFFDMLKQKQYKTDVRIFLSRYRGYDDCEDCQGTRLGPDARCVRVGGLRIGDLWMLRVEEARQTLRQLDITDHERAQVQILIDEILFRLDYLHEVGLGYLTLDRQTRTLSGGETQRIHLTTSLGRALTDTLYVLDEPTAGLHASDSTRLLGVLHRLRDLGNTVVVVEHDPEIIEGADHIIELGPDAGEAGGALIFAGPMADFLKADTLTSRMLQGRGDAATLATPREASPMTETAPIVIRGAREHNLDRLDVALPTGLLTAVTGVSGSGKSTLLHRVLFNAWRRSQGQGGVEAPAVDAVEGLDAFEEVILMSQSAIGRSSRSNALSYTKAYDDIRKLYSQTERAKLDGLTMGDFSFNTPGGRCEKCQGAGKIVIEMHFMADIEITCPECEGKRFTPRVLAATYRDHNIDDVLNLTVDDAMRFFADHRPIINKLSPLIEVGLGYLRLGQPTTTLSGGEAQRLKLATYIAAGRRQSDTRPVLFIFDEPTVGLHMRDVTVLLIALNKLVALGHTVLVIEHNTDFIAQCDYVVDLGPGAGPHGGKIVAQGSPHHVSQCAESLTGQHLRALWPTP